MAVRHTFESGGVVLTVVTGERFTTAELVEALARAFEDPAARTPVRLLMDNRGSKESASAEEIRRRVALLVEHAELFHPRVAVVVDDALHYGIARVGDALLEPHGVDVGVFEDPDAALAWLVADP